MNVRPDRIGLGKCESATDNGGVFSDSGKSSRLPTEYWREFVATVDITTVIQASRLNGQIYKSAVTDTKAANLWAQKWNDSVIDNRELHEKW